MNMRSIQGSDLWRSLSSTACSLILKSVTAVMPSLAENIDSSAIVNADFVCPSSGMLSSHIVCLWLPQSVSLLSVKIFYYLGQHIVPTYVYLGELSRGVLFSWIRRKVGFLIEPGLSIASYTSISRWRGDVEEAWVR